MIIGITGFSGVLGRAICKELSSLKNCKIVKYKNDILNKSRVKKWILDNDFDIIIHLAAVVPIKQFNNSNKYAEDVNYKGTINVVDSLKFTKKKVFLFFSSTSHVYKKSYSKINEKSVLMAINRYGLSKLKAEKYIQSYQKRNNFDYSIGRIFSYTSIYQTEDFFIPSMFKKIRKTKNTFIVNFKNEYRDFIHINDIVLMIKKLILNKKTGIYNICSGNKVSTHEIIKKICNKMKKKYSFLYEDKKFLGLLGSNSKIKKIYKKDVKSIDYIIKDYFNFFKR